MDLIDYGFFVRYACTFVDDLQMLAVCCVEGEIVTIVVFMGSIVRTPGQETM